MASTPSTSSATPSAVALEIDGLTASMAELRPPTLEKASSVQLPVAASLQETSRWLNRARLGRFPPRKEHAAVIVDNIIYSFGGVVGDFEEPSYSRDAVDVFVLNVKRRDKTWKRLPIQNSEVKPNQRCSHSAVAYKECVIIFGGWDIKKQKASNSTYSFNTDTLKWEQLEVTGIVPLPCSNHSAVVIGHEMYIYVEAKGISPPLLEGHSAIVYKDRLMLIFGGRDATLKEEMNTILSFDFNAKTWTRVKTHGIPPESRKGHCACKNKYKFCRAFLNLCDSAAHVVHNGLMFVYGGGQDFDDNYHFSDVFSFDLETCRWDEIYPDGNTPAPREGAGCVALNDRAFIFGGYYSYDVFDDVYLDDTQVLRL